MQLSSSQTAPGSKLSMKVFQTVLVVHLGWVGASCAFHLAPTTLLWNKTVGALPTFLGPRLASGRLLYGE